MFFLLNTTVSLPLIKDLIAFFTLPKASSFVFNTSFLDRDKYNDNTIEYEFDETNGIVTRKVGKANNITDEGTYQYIKEFSISPVSDEKYGANVKIVGGMEQEADKHDKSRFELNSSFYSRNTR